MPEEDNAIELWLGRALSSRLESQTRRALRHLLERSRAAAIPVIASAHTDSRESQLESHLEQPAQGHTDRQGEAMLILADIDFASLPKTDVTNLVMLPNSGRLTIFCSRQILSAPAKERRNFKVIFTPAEKNESEKSEKSEKKDQVILPLTIDEGSRSLLKEMEALGINALFRDEICTAVNSYNRSQAGANYLLGAACAGMEEDLEVCAFATGGISHNAARAKDSHYAHLVGEAKQWRLLARFRETVSNTNIGSDLKEARLYMRPQDLAEKLFDRAWLLCR